MRPDRRAQRRQRRFPRALPRGAEWYEIEKGRDFLRAAGHRGWAVGNPPFSRFRDFLRKAMELADNVVLVALAPPCSSKPGDRGLWTVDCGQWTKRSIALAPAWFVRARQEDLRQARFALVELCALPIPPDCPQLHRCRSHLAGSVAVPGPGVRIAV